MVLASPELKGAKGDKGDKGDPGAPGVVSSASAYVIVGPGRPDQPATTGGVIKGSEPVGAEYRSTDGAGAGLFDWMKRPTGWVNTGGGSGVEQVSGTVTLDASGAPIREFFTTGATTFKANGADTLLSSFIAVVWRRNSQGSWGYQVVQDSWTTPTPTPDTTAPVAGTLAVTVTDVKADLTVSGASDDRGYVQYSFSKDNGATWTGYQDAATYSFTGLSPSTAYQFRQRVKDSAGNVTTGTAVSKMTNATPPWGAVYADDFTAPDGTALVGRAVPTAPSPTTYQTVLDSAPTLSGGRLIPGALSSVSLGWGVFKFSGAMIDVKASNKVEYTVSWKSGDTHPEGVALIYGATGPKHFQALIIAGTSNQRWYTVKGGEQGGEVNLATPFSGGPSYGGNHTMTATITRTGTSATLDVVVNGVKKLNGYALPELTYTGTLMGIGASSGGSTTTATIDSWSVTAV